MYSIRTKILAITLACIVFLGTAFVLYSIATTENYKRLRLEGIKKTLEFETEKINKIIAALERGATNLVIDGLLFFQSQSYSIGETSVLEFLRSFSAAAGGGFWFEPYAFNKNKLHASIYAFYDKDSGELLMGDIENYNHYEKNWYREIVDKIKRPYQTAWARPFVGDLSLSLKTAVGAGIFDHEGNLIGVSVIDWGMEEAIRDLTAIHPTENSFVVLCAPEEDYVISDTYTNSLMGTTVKSIPWDINANSFFLEGVSYLSFSQFLDNGWLLSVQIPQNEIFAEVESQNNSFSIIIAFVSAIMICIAYYLVSKLINDPIKQLTSDLADLALGNLDIQIKVTTKDELGMFAKTFNKMTTDLKESLEAHDRERAEKERIAAELSVAAEIQSSMIPCIFPPFPSRSEFDIYATMLPAKEMSGDFYDFYMVDENNLAIVIADVSGKGIPAALFMVITKTMIRDCSSWESPKNVFEEVNKKLCYNNESSMFVTAFLGFYNIPTGRFIYVNAGHVPPLVKKGGGGFEFLKIKPGIVLGFTENAKYSEEEIILETGDIFYLYTDGVTEALNTDMAVFSEQRLLEAINKCKDYSPKDLVSAIKQEMDNFTGREEQSDDTTMLALKVSHLTDPAVKELTVQAIKAKLNEVLDFVNAELKGNNYPPELQGEIDVVAEEIFINIANYAYEQEAGEATISIAGGREEMLLRFEDSGRPFNPLGEKDPDLDKPLAERQLGGIGIFLVKKLMDKVTYIRLENKNVLTMTKKIK